MFNIGRDIPQAQKKKPLAGWINARALTVWGMSTTEAVLFIAIVALMATTALALR